jgi:hypothetical protein
MSGITSQYFARIITEFDQDKFGILQPKPSEFARKIIAIRDFEQLLFDYKFPVEIIDQLVRSYLDSTPSVTALWMCYGGSPTVASKYDLLLPLSGNPVFLNAASKIVLIKLGQTLSKDNRDHFKELMTYVFTHHFKKLDTSHKLQLFQKSNVFTSWEQTSADQKLRLFGRVQVFCGWSHPQIKLQFLMWKVRFAVAYVIKKDILFWMVVGPIFLLGAMTFANLLFLFLLGIFGPTLKNEKIETVFSWIVATLSPKVMLGILSGLGISASCGAISLFFLALGALLNTRHFPKHIQKKGAWIQSMSWSGLEINLNCILILLDFLVPKGNKLPGSTSLRDLYRALDNLGDQLKETINEAQIPVEQATLLEAQLPDLLEKWQVFVAEKFNLSDTDTESSPKQLPLAAAEMAR